MLEIHVINKGIGESIILQLPNKKWGVIDCYTSTLEDKNKNMTLNFLKEKGVETLAFIALTHPHEDHYKGFSHILEEYQGKIERVFFFDALDSVKLVTFLENEARVYEDTKRAFAVKELIKILRGINKLKNVRKRALRECNKLYADSDNEFEMWAIGPTKNQIDKYEMKIINVFDNNRMIKNTDATDKNLISGVIYIKYGETGTILSGDADKSSFQDILINCTEIGFNLHFDAIKVSHHGSSDAFSEDLWKKRKNGKVYAIITPALKYSLPSKEVLKNIHDKNVSILLTYPPLDEGNNTDKDSYLYDLIEDGDIVFKLIEDTEYYYDNDIEHDDKVMEYGICSLKFDKKGIVDKKTLGHAYEF